MERLAVVFMDGFGDALLFGRYLRALCGRAERLSAIVPKLLRSLFERNTTPWFPSALVFRQGNDRKWKRVMRALPTR